MSPDHGHLGSERDQTDESLRLEREKADHALEEQLAAIDETADAVISRARSRADAVLAAARKHTDAQPAARARSPLSRQIVRQERVLADDALRNERSTADETLRQERAEHVGLLSAERGETDKDLLSERERSDAALATRDEFLGIVGHDLRTMLNAVVGFAAMIGKAVEREGHASEVLLHARRIDRSALRMNRLIGDLLDVASIEAGRLGVTREMANPAAVVAEASETFDAQALAGGVSLETEIGAPAISMSFDPARILQVLTNLLSNAIKFTPRAGTVRVRMERIDDHMCFSVSDTGPGIAADKLEAVFARFLQVNPNDRRGVGLGLYISKCIVEGHGGRIWVESTVGAGSTFRFTLPIGLAA
jgi:signal transduction histidine kinase